MDFSTKWRNGLNSKDAEPETPHWDFGRNVSQTVKLQIKLLLSYVDKTVKNKEEKTKQVLTSVKVSVLLCRKLRTSGYF